MHIVYGGAFNPPTKAHYEVYRYLKEKLPVTRFTYLPVSRGYTKGELASNYHRLKMLKIMTKDLDDVVISDLEMTDNDFQGTYQSLIRLSDDDREDTAFVIGADNLFSLPKWIMASSLVGEFKIIVLNRNGTNLDSVFNSHPMLKKNREQFIVFNDFSINISSTKYRETLDKNLVCEAVHTYVIDHQLYKR